MTTLKGFERGLKLLVANELASACWQPESSDLQMLIG
jgi:hypothetical protein